MGVLVRKNEQADEWVVLTIQDRAERSRPIGFDNARIVASADVVKCFPIKALKREARGGDKRSRYLLLKLVHASFMVGANWESGVAPISGITVHRACASEHSTAG